VDFDVIDQVLIIYTVHSSNTVEKMGIH